MNSIGPLEEQTKWPQRLEQGKSGFRRLAFGEPAPRFHKAILSDGACESERRLGEEF